MVSMVSSQLVYFGIGSELGSFLGSQSVHTIIDIHFITAWGSLLGGRLFGGRFLGGLFGGRLRFGRCFRRGSLG